METMISTSEVDGSKQPFGHPSIQSSELGSSSPHNTINSKQPLKDLLKVILDCDPTCKLCSGFIIQLTQHIREEHPDLDHDSNNEYSRSTFSDTVTGGGSTTAPPTQEEEDIHQQGESEQQVQKRKLSVTKTPNVNTKKPRKTANENNSTVIDDDDIEVIDLEEDNPVEVNEEVQDGIKNEFSSGSESDNATTTVCDSDSQEGSENENSNTEGESNAGENSAHKCTSCGRFFVSAEILRTHTELHKKTPFYKCKTCGARLRSENGLKNHEDRKHPEKKEIHDCDTCGKQFSKEVTLKIHKRIHRRSQIEGLYNCEQCERVFISKAELESHVRYHEFSVSGEIVFPCKVCDIPFTNRKDLEKHCLEIHKGEATNAQRLKSLPLLF